MKVNARASYMLSSTLTQVLLVQREEHLVKRLN